MSTADKKWENRRLKYIAKLNMGQSPPSEHVVKFDENDGFPFLQGNAEFGKISPNPKHTCSDPPKIAEKGDLLISVRAPVGALNEADQSYGIGRGLCAITWRKIFPRYGWWLMHTSRVQLDVLATGSTYEAVSAEDVANIVVPFPDQDTQRLIADYLDRETAHIDALVAEKEKMLALLAEKRAALISRAVTKGLNPDASMKPSGLDWLGEIPAHWRIERAKNLFSIRDQRSETGEEELLTVSHITGVTRRSEKDVYMFQADDKCGYKQCFPGDLVVNTLWAWMGAMGVSSLEGIVSPDYHVYTSKGLLLPKFVEFLCRSRPFVAEVNRWSKGVWSSRLRLYPENFFEMRLPVPPRNEQREIVEVIEREQQKAKELVDTLRRSIALAKERRAALITAAVTGQIPIEEMRT